jgi:uncharacterized protein (TIGR02117 family)
LGRPACATRGGRRRLRQGAGPRQAARAAPALLALLTGLITAACLGPVRDLHPPRAGEATVTVRVVGHGWHTGLVVPREVVGPDGGGAGTAPFLELGWGDRTFYQVPDAGIGLALEAAFASAGSVLHVTGLERAPAGPIPGLEIVTIELSRRGAEALARFVADAFVRDGAGRPIDLGPGLDPGSRFYAATGRYSLLYTCNTWIADALRAAGCPITPFWAATASTLIHQARRCAPDPARR